MSKFSRRNVLALGAASAMVPSAFAAVSAKAGAAAWPTQPVRLLIGFPPGSVQDLSARAIAPALSEELGKPVIVENKAGASGIIAGEQVAHASDLHTFGVMNNSQSSIAKLLNPAASYDPAKDLTPVALLATTPLMLVVSTAAPGKTPVEYLAWLRNLGAKGNYGSPGAGTPGHLGMELIKLRTQLQMLHVPYPGNPQVINALLSGQLHAGLMPPGLVMQHIRAGKLRAVGVTSSSRSALAPDFPTLRESDVLGADVELYSALTGPKLLPQPIQERMGAATIAVLRRPEVRQALLNAGWQATAANAEGLRIRMKNDTKIFGGIIMMSNIRADS